MFFREAHQEPNTEHCVQTINECFIIEKIAARSISSTFQVSRNPGKHVKDQTHQQGSWLYYLRLCIQQMPMGKLLNATATAGNKELEITR
jgi:hypothetical protein